MSRQLPPAPPLEHPPAAADAPGLPQVEIFTDGACRGNPGPGGWAALMRWGAIEKELTGGDPATTNNRMELMAVIQALEALKRPVQGTLYTDSEYVQKGITQWLRGWKARNWRTRAGAVANRDLWERLDAALGRHPHRLSFQWVRGHAGHPENERVDRLSREAIPRDG